MKKILFICLGNICRSPAAEGIFNNLVLNNNLKDKFYIDSAGTSAYHQGDLPDARMREHAKKRGYILDSLSRQVKKTDFENFDLLLVMDDSNLANLLKLKPNSEQTKKIKKITDYCKIHDASSVPDPYYKGEQGFELVLDILEDACNELFLSLRKDKNI